MNILSKIDFADFLITKYTKIDNVYKKSFWYIFIGLNIIFGFHTINFFYGNHDWYMILTRVKPHLELLMGRYTEGYLGYLMTMGMYLPIITNELTFIVLTLTGIAFCHFIQLPKKTYLFTIIGLLLTGSPFTLHWLFFTFAELDYNIPALLVILAFIFSFKGENQKTKIYYNLCSTALIIAALGIYPSVLNTIGVLFFGNLLIQSKNWNNCSEIKID